MIKSLGTEFKVGLFTLIAAATLGYMLFVLSPDSFENKNKNVYFTVLSDASGIVPKSHVKTNGVTVGKVRSVDLEANTTRIRMEVDAGVKIPVGSKMEIRTRGLLGDVFLEIVRGKDNGEYVKDGGFLPRSDDQLDMQALVKLGGDIAKDVKRITNAFANAVGTEDGQNSLKSTIDNIRALSEDLKQTSQTIRHVVGDRETDLNAIVSNIREGMNNLKTFSTNLRDVLDGENREKIDRILATVDESMSDVRGATKNIKMISEKVEKGEGTIGRLINDDTAMTEIEGAIKDIREVLAPVRKTQIIVDSHVEIQKDSTHGSFSLALMTRPDRYYLIGLSDGESASVERTTETEPAVGTDSGGTRVKTVEKSKSETQLKVNLQFAKRWYFAGLRFGLFESAVGFASDFYLISDRLRFSFEAFDWKTKDNTIRRVAHLKAYASVLFFNHIYAMFGVDDPTKKDPSTGDTRALGYFVGAGLTFNDQDLKAIFGTAAAATAGK